MAVARLEYLETDGAAIVIKRGSSARVQVEMPSRSSSLDEKRLFVRTILSMSKHLDWSLQAVGLPANQRARTPQPIGRVAICILVTTWIIDITPALS